MCRSATPYLFALSVSLIAASIQAEEPVVVDLWPNDVPGFKVEGGPERDTSGPDSGKVAGRHVIRLGDVSTPQIHVYQPPADKRNGASIVICPGGGFNILAWDLEGTEVAEWLNSIGVTAAVLKYRVPTAKHDPKWLPPVQDAQRAISLVRSRADEWGLDPQRVGLLGFSAGGNTAAMTAVSSERRYEADDAKDKASCRPDFLVLVYPAYLVDESGELRSEVTVTKETPPTFLAHAYDDPVTPKSSVEFFLALKNAGVPAELHVYDAGGHGYGLRKTDQPVTMWNDRCGEWMKSRGLRKARE
ncbi:MAG: alpha/beta hydrolase [Planctomycetota bacterium]|nr:alpha/beta hydrolase [Planctomycetota bacterium]